MGAVTLSRQPIHRRCGCPTPRDSRLCRQPRDPTSADKTSNGLLRLRVGHSVLAWSQARRSSTPTMSTKLTSWGCHPRRRGPAFLRATTSPSAPRATRPTRSSTPTLTVEASWVATASPRRDTQPGADSGPCIRSGSARDSPYLVARPPRTGPPASPRSRRGPQPGGLAVSDRVLGYAPAVSSSK